MATHALTTPATLARRRHTRAAPDALDRRSLFGAMGGAVAVAAIASRAKANTPSGPSGPDAELLAACNEYLALMRAERAAVEAMTEAESQAHHAAAVGAMMRDEPGPAELLVSRIASMPARTSTGLQTKALALRFHFGGSDDVDPFDRRQDALLASVLQDVLRGVA